MQFLPVQRAITMCYMQTSTGLKSTMVFGFQSMQLNIAVLNISMKFSVFTLDQESAPLCFSLLIRVEPQVSESSY